MLYEFKLTINEVTKTLVCKEQIQNQNYFSEDLMDGSSKGPKPYVWRDEFPPEGW